ncbi:MAG: hypothetical protein NC041_04530 [Bacteroides sp.]|nr:hypothetical protein [Prevotella sp.]MCM1407971.1 hypothetical protein [Treponema brennaborense]MCM1469713.1 hypothetical protein [Bacteroides sp.]
MNVAQLNNQEVSGEVNGNTITIDTGELAGTITLEKVDGATAKAEGSTEDSEALPYTKNNFTDAIKANTAITLDTSKSPTQLKAEAAAIDGGKIILQSPSAGNLRLRDDGTINYNGDSKRYVAVDTSKFGVSSGKLTVSFDIKVVGSTSSSDDIGVAFLSASAEDCPQDSKAFTVPTGALASETGLKVKSGSDTRTLSAAVDAGTKVYLFFSRNGAGGGGIDVTKISVTSAQ